MLGEKLVMSPRDPMSCLEAAAEARNLVVFRREVVSWGCLKYIRSCEHCFAKREKKKAEKLQEVVRKKQRRCPECMNRKDGD